MAVDPRRKNKYYELRGQGWRQAAAAREAKISVASAVRFDKERPEIGVAARVDFQEALVPDGVVAFESLAHWAQRAYNDFEYFRSYYLGHESLPWQLDAAEKAVELLESPHKEFIVVNCPPGVGKTTLFTHDIPAWLTVRDRRIRGIIGSRTQRQASTHLTRLRRTLERVFPLEDAVGVIAKDYGRFRPTRGEEQWSRDEITVIQPEGEPTDDKEPTWTSFGMDSGQLGWRVNYITWDDVVDRVTTRTLEAQETQRRWWDEEAETRLEPGGVLVLPGQRYRSTDLYRYCLDKRIAPDDDETDPSEGEPQYRHVKYKAHYEDICEGVHRASLAQPYPNGCLLDPIRLPWRDLRTVIPNKDKFEVLYQQEDLDPNNVLVQKHWVDGGRGLDGIEYPGCWDKDRASCELPYGIAGRKISIVSVDPSPTKFWSIQWWIVCPDTGYRYLMDLVRQKMGANEWLDESQVKGQYVGIAEDWWQRSKQLNLPFTHLIVEANAAQRFMMQYQFFRQWASTRGVNLIPHETHKNKSNPDYGIQMLPALWEHGLVRLPHKGAEGRLASMKLVEEVTRYPDSGSDDCVMAHWFVEFNVNRLVLPDTANAHQKRPSWLGGLRRTA